MKKFFVILFSIFILASILLIPSFAQNRIASSISIATDKVYLFFDYVDDEDDPFESFDLELKLAGGIWRVVDNFTYEDMSSIEKTYKIPDSVLNTIEVNRSFADYRLHGFTLNSDSYSSSVRVTSSGVQDLIASFDSPYRIVWNQIIGATSYNVRFESSVFGTLDYYTDAITLYFNLPDTITVGGLLPADTKITVRTTLNGVTYSSVLYPLSGYTIITIPVDTSLPKYQPNSDNDANVALGLLWRGVTQTSVWHYVIPSLLVCATMGGLVFIINKVH